MEDRRTDSGHLVACRSNNGSTALSGDVHCGLGVRDTLTIHLDDGVGDLDAVVWILHGEFGGRQRWKGEG